MVEDFSTLRARASRSGVFFHEIRDSGAPIWMVDWGDKKGINPYRWGDAPTTDNAKTAVDWAGNRLTFNDWLVDDQAKIRDGFVIVEQALYSYSWNERRRAVELAGSRGVIVLSISSRNTGRFLLKFPEEHRAGKKEDQCAALAFAWYLSEHPNYHLLPLTTRDPSSSNHVRRVDRLYHSKAEKVWREFDAFRRTDRLEKTMYGEKHMAFFPTFSASSNHTFVREVVSDEYGHDWAWQFLLSMVAAFHAAGNARDLVDNFIGLRANGPPAYWRSRVFHNGTGHVNTVVGRVLGSLGISNVGDVADERRYMAARKVVLRRLRVAIKWLYYRYWENHGPCDCGCGKGVDGRAIEASEGATFPSSSPPMVDGEARKTIPGMGNLDRPLLDEVRDAIGKVTPGVPKEPGTPGGIGEILESQPTMETHW